VIEIFEIGQSGRFNGLEKALIRLVSVYVSLKGRGLAVLAGSRNTVRRWQLETFTKRVSTRTSRQNRAQTNVPSAMDGSLRTQSIRSARTVAGSSMNNEIKHRPEWRAHDDEECVRTGAQLTAACHDRGLSTEIRRGTDAKGNELSGKKRQRLALMRRE
jgi:transcription initiation factor TFIIB